MAVSAAYDDQDDMSMAMQLKLVMGLPVVSAVIVACGMFLLTTDRWGAKWDVRRDALDLH